VDQMVRLWDVQSSSESHELAMDEDDEPVLKTRKPLVVYQGKSAFNAIDHHRTDPLFATACNTVQLWDETKTSPIMNLTFPTSTETVTALKFNQSEASILATTGSDRTFTLYDVRTGKAERRLVFQMRANALSWSPTQPTCILLASEDHNLYTFDVRSLTSPTQIYKGHVAAVMSCDWGPTGTDFVSGGWDRTIRLWKEGAGKGSEVYHTKRMQRVFSTTYTGDARFVLSGSDDGNVRLWKANASDKLGIVAGRERAAREYRATLREKWKYDPEVGKIERRRHLPKAIYSTAKLKTTMLDSRKTKEERRRQHSRAGENKPKAERKKVVVVEQT